MIYASLNSNSYFVPHLTRFLFKPVFSDLGLVSKSLQSSSFEKQGEKNNTQEQNMLLINHNAR